MSCGGKSSKALPVIHAHGVDVPSCTPWLSDFLACLILTLEEARTRGLDVKFKRAVGGVAMANGVLPRPERGMHPRN